MPDLTSLLCELTIASGHARRADISREMAAADLHIAPDLDWGLARVRSHGPYYEPDPEGVWAFIVPAFDDAGSEAGELIDLVATSLRRGVRTRRGEARALGYRNIDQARAHGRPLALFDDPVSWLAGGRVGAVIIDWREAPRLLDGMPQLICQSPTLARRLARAFARPVPLPPLVVPRSTVSPVTLSQLEELRHAA